jgi:predicted RNase H-like nuclease (RuvC/YqgF family)
VSGPALDGVKYEVRELIRAVLAEQTDVNHPRPECQMHLRDIVEPLTHAVMGLRTAVDTLNSRITTLVASLEKLEDQIEAQEARIALIERRLADGDTIKKAYTTLVRTIWVIVISGIAAVGGLVALVQKVN